MLVWIVTILIVLCWISIKLFMNEYKKKEFL